MLKDILENDFEIYLNLVFGKHLGEDSQYVNLPITDELKDELKAICKMHIDRISNEYNQQFNIVGGDDNVIESYDMNTNLMGLANLGEIFTEENKIYDIDDDEIKNYSYYIIELTFEDKTIYFVRKPFKPQAIKKGTILSKNDRGRYKLINAVNLIVFDLDIDFVVTDKTYYIFQRKKFESSFDFSEVYNFLVHQVLDNQALNQGVEDFETLRFDIESNLHLRRRVAGLFNNEKTTLFLEQREVTMRIIKDYELDLKFEDDKLLYEDKSQAKHIVAFMQDAFYETFLGKDTGTDTRRN